MSDSREHVQGYIPEDVSNKFESYRKRQDLNQSEAVNRLIRKGLYVEESTEYTREQARTFASQLFVTLGVALVVLGSWAMLSTSRAQISFGLIAGGVVAIGLAWPIHSGHLPVVDSE